jgi:hypothetical protein
MKEGHEAQKQTALESTSSSKQTSEGEIVTRNRSKDKKL